MVTQVISWQYRKKVVSWRLSMGGHKSPKLAHKSILITIKTPNNHFYPLAWETEPLPAGAGRIEFGLEAFSAFLNAVPSTAI